LAFLHILLAFLHVLLAFLHVPKAFLHILRTLKAYLPLVSRPMRQVLTGHQQVSKRVHYPMASLRLESRRQHSLKAVLHTLKACLQLE
jgi:hypothetical protein